MDYEFLRDITGVVKVRMSMGHEVVGHWFNEEVKEKARTKLNAWFDADEIIPADDIFKDNPTDNPV